LKAWLRQAFKTISDFQRLTIRAKIVDFPILKSLFKEETTVFYPFIMMNFKMLDYRFEFYIYLLQ